MIKVASDRREGPRPASGYSWADQLPKSVGGCSLWSRMAL